MRFLSTVVVFSPRRHSSLSHSTARDLLIHQSWFITRIEDATPGVIQENGTSNDLKSKTIKLIINGAFVAFSGDIITDYQDSYGLYMVNIIMSAFVIVETPNKHYSTHAQISCLNQLVANYLNIEKYLQVSQKQPDCPCKVGIAPLYCPQCSHCRLLFQIQETVLRKTL